MLIECNFSALLEGSALTFFLPKLTPIYEQEGVKISEPLVTYSKTLFSLLLLFFIIIIIYFAYPLY